MKLTCFVLISIFHSVLAALRVLCLHMLPLVSEELLRLRFCLGFLFVFSFVEGAMRVFMVFYFYQFSMKFVYWCLIRSTEISDSINFCLGPKEEGLGLVAVVFSGGNGECDQVDWGGQCCALSPVFVVSFKHHI